MSLIFSVPQNVARNPVARAIERKRCSDWLKVTTKTIHDARTGEHCPSLLRACVEALSISVKTIQGWDDPQDIGSELVEAIDTCADMVRNNSTWDEAHAGKIADALDAAIQILNAQDPRAKVRAWMWTEQVKNQIWS